MKKIFLIISILIINILHVNAQDILASISVSSSGVEGTDRAVFDAMQKALTDLVNGRKWTPYQLKPDERFKLRLAINVNERISDTEFKGTINVAMGRVIFNTNYDSPVFNFMDQNLHFYYNQFEPMEYVENVFTNNLVAVVAYYIYYSLGMQFDTFQSSGGQEFFTKAKDIVQTSQSSRETGWNSAEGDKSRYWLVEYMLNPAYRGLRSFLYQYHRQGLDIMADNVENGRTFIIRALEDLRRAYEERPGMYLTQLMIDTKRDEIINIFRGASDSEKTTVIDIMKRIDPANASKYDAMRTSNSSTGTTPGINSTTPGRTSTGTGTGTSGTFRP